MAPARKEQTPPEVPENDEDYHSSSDEDFNPDDAPAEEELSSSEDEVAPPPAKGAQRGRKRKQLEEEEDAFDSGDEETIRERKRAKRRKRKGEVPKGDEDEGVMVFSDDEGGEGGLIRTRAQRMREEKERRPLATAHGATVDVDAIWARLISAPVTRDIEAETLAQQKHDQSVDGEEPTAEVEPPSKSEEYITIKRSYRFAGQVQTEEKRVPKSSEEARLYLAEQEKASKPAESENDQKDTAADGDDAPLPEEKPIRRPLKRPSRFEPNPLGEVKGLPPQHQLRWPRTAPGIGPLRPANANALTAAAASAAARLGPGNKPQKLNTVEKSRYDWVQYVDKEGISAELDEYGKAKESYLGRMQFLGRTEDKLEGERRRIRLGGSAAAGSGARPAL